jgi:hypothetical protein
MRSRDDLFYHNQGVVSEPGDGDIDIPGKLPTSDPDDGDIDIPGILPTSSPDDGDRYSRKITEFRP